jgi:hypothetical protein
VLLYERWYDLYQSPDGQTAERRFTAPIAAGTAESAWADPALFAGYDGMGDSAIWTGTALNAILLRYLETGTEADYARLEAKVRTLLTLFDVTGIPGYLARHHFLLLPEGGPDSPDHIVLFGEGPRDARDRAVDDPESVAGLPDAYAEGIADSQGELWTGTPMWRGNPSIDQYTGPMVTFPAVYGLLQDEGLRQSVADALVCYLHRLQRIEVVHLQDNPDALEAVQTFLAGGHLQLDPDDIDLTQLDTLVAYAHPQINTANQDFYDRSCPESVALAPARVIDASDSGFGLDLLNLVADLTGGAARATALDHIYVPSVRGGDAIHMMHLAAMAWYFTGDDQYRELLEEELLGRLRTAEVAQTTGALVPPRWCRAFYGTHITLPPLWAFINLLEDSPLRDEMVRVFELEGWQKLAFDLANPKYELMYAGVVPDELATARDEALSEALATLAAFGGNGGVLEDPRRNYTLGYTDAVEALPEGIEPVCPTEELRHACEDGYDILGVPLPGTDITRACTGDPGECPMEGGECARSLASAAVPPELFPYEDFFWQRSPFQLGRTFGDAGMEQAPGLDLIEIFWLARHYGFTDVGEGQVLAGRETGSCV